MRPRCRADGRDEAARLLQLAELDPVLDEEGRLAWTALEGEGDFLFLGLEGETPLFAPLVRVESFGQRAWSVFRLLSLMSAQGRRDLGRGAKSSTNGTTGTAFAGFAADETALFRGGWGRQVRAMRGRAFPARRSGGDHARRA